MCCCSRTIFTALDSPAIEGKYDQECSYQNVQLRRLPESSLDAEDVLLNPEVIGGTYG